MRGYSLEPEYKPVKAECLQGMESFVLVELGLEIFSIE
jgi:hypothetical protein